MSKNVKMLSVHSFLGLFPNEEAVCQWFEQLRWPNGTICPHCQSDQVRAIENCKPMPYRCRTCRKHFSVGNGSILAESKIPLQKWALAIYLFTRARKGTLSTQLARELGVTQKTAWFLDHRIREAWERSNGVFDGQVEADETFIGGKEKNKLNSKKLRAGRGAVGKAPVAGVVHRESKSVQAQAVES